MAAAAGVALINTIGNLAGFSAPFITGAVRDWTGGYEVPMMIVGGVMLVSAILMVVLARQNKAAVTAAGLAAANAKAEDDAASLRAPRP